jgi:hypothetical protein
MASDRTAPANSASLSDEEEMATYYIMERAHEEREEQAPNGFYRPSMHKGYPKAGSSQSIRKYSNSRLFTSAIARVGRSC